jgi:hypothetical protein
MGFWKVDKSYLLILQVVFNISQTFLITFKINRNWNILGIKNAKTLLDKLINLLPRLMKKFLILNSLLPVSMKLLSKIFKIIIILKFLYPKNSKFKKMLNNQLNKKSPQKLKMISMQKNLQLKKFKNQTLNNQLSKTKNLKKKKEISLKEGAEATEEIAIDLLKE